MSVVIKDFDTPEKCQMCPCCYIENETALPPNKPGKPICSVWGDRIQDMYSKRNDNCPLIPLPQKHGRLIDADFLLGRLKEFAKGYDPNTFHVTMLDVYRWLEYSTAVIEAEDGE